MTGKVSPRKRCAESRRSLRKRMCTELVGREAAPLGIFARVASALADATLLQKGMGDPGFEPGTSALSERRSNQLS